MNSGRGMANSIANIFGVHANTCLFSIVDKEKFCKRYLSVILNWYHFGHQKFLVHILRFLFNVSAVVKVHGLIRTVAEAIEVNYTVHEMLNSFKAWNFLLFREHSIYMVHKWYSVSTQVTPYQNTLPLTSLVSQFQTSVSAALQMAVVSWQGRQGRRRSYFFHWIYRQHHKFTLTFMPPKFLALAFLNRNHQWSLMVKSLLLEVLIS
jgi:hypothetical protein